MSKRKVTFEDGDGEIELDEDPPNKKVALYPSCHVHKPEVEIRSPVSQSGLQTTTLDYLIVIVYQMYKELLQ